MSQRPDNVMDPSDQGIKSDASNVLRHGSVSSVGSEDEPASSARSPPTTQPPHAVREQASENVPDSHPSSIAENPRHMVCASEIFPRVFLMCAPGGSPYRIILRDSASRNVEYWIEEQVTLASRRCLVFETGSSDAESELETRAGDLFRNQFLSFSAETVYSIPRLCDLFAAFTFWLSLDKESHIAVLDCTLPNFSIVGVGCCLLAFDSTVEAVLSLLTSRCDNLRIRASDKRYLSYFHKILHSSTTFRSRPILIKQLLVDACFCSETELEVLIRDSHGSECLNEQMVQFYDDESHSVAMHFPNFKNRLFQGDVEIILRSRRISLSYKFNTAFIDNLTSSSLHLPLREWDGIPGVVYPEKFSAQIITAPATNTTASPIVVSPISIPSDIDERKNLFLARHAVKVNPQSLGHFRSNRSPWDTTDIELALKICENDILESSECLRALFPVGESIRHKFSGPLSRLKGDSPLVSGSPPSEVQEVPLPPLPTTEGSSKTTVEKALEDSASIRTYLSQYSQRSRRTSVEAELFKSPVERSPVPQYEDAVEILTMFSEMKFSPPELGTPMFSVLGDSTGLGERGSPKLPQNITAELIESHEGISDNVGRLRGESDETRDEGFKSPIPETARVEGIESRIVDEEEQKSVGGERKRVAKSPPVVDERLEIDSVKSVVNNEGVTSVPVVNDSPKAVTGPPETSLSLQVRSEGPAMSPPVKGEAGMAPPIPTTPPPVVGKAVISPPLPTTPPPVNRKAIIAPPLPASPPPVNGKPVTSPPIPTSPPQVSQGFQQLSLQVDGDAVIFPSIPTSTQRVSSGEYVTPPVIGKAVPPPLITHSPPSPPQFKKGAAPPLPGRPSLGKASPPSLPSERHQQAPAIPTEFRKAVASLPLRRAPPPSLDDSVVAGKKTGNEGQTEETAGVPATLPLGRKLHWKPLRNVESTIWETLDVDTSADFSGLKQVFEDDNAGKPKAAAGVPSGGQAGNPSSHVVTLFEGKRAQNIGVVVARVPIEVMTAKLTSLDAEALSIENLERLKMILPTEEEAQIFNQFKGEISALRDIEQRVLHLFRLPRLSQRIRFCLVSLQLPGALNELQTEIQLLRKCGLEIRNSGKLKKTLHVVLLLGNYVNRGETRGFSIESLGKLMEFKSASDPGITTLHFLAARLLSSDPSLVELYQEMPSLKQVVKITPESITQGVTMARNDPEAVKNELKSHAGMYSPEAVERMRTFVGMIEPRIQGLVSEWSACEKELVELRKFFGEDPKKLSVDDFFGHLRNFIDSLANACFELKKRPKKFEKIVSGLRSGDSSVTETPVASASGTSASISSSKPVQWSKKSTEEVVKESGGKVPAPVKVAVPSGSSGEWKSVKRPQTLSDVHLRSSGP